VPLAREERTVQKIKCPRCGGDAAADAACPSCGHAVGNGLARRIKPQPPPELANRVFTPVPPEMAEEFRRTFNEEEYLAAVRELERAGGVQIDDLIEELERRVDGRA
jgi:predicted amidophosphoribosyltransferase